MRQRSPPPAGLSRIIGPDDEDVTFLPLPGQKPDISVAFPLFPSAGGV